MNSQQTKFGKNIYHRFSRLPLRDQLAIGWKIIRLQSRILLSNKFYFFVAAVFGYFIIAYVINYNEEMMNRLSQTDILPALFMLPMTVISIFLNMQVIASEKDSRTLEVMLTTAGSRNKVWLLRLATLNLLLLLLCTILSTLAFFSFADMAILPTAIHAFVPTFFVGNMTFHFAVKFRSGFTAAMAAAAFMFFVMMFTDALEETRYFLFFNPFDMPRQLDPETWNLWMWQNRIGVLLLGGFMLFLGLRGLENREKMLR